jgi:hypothetical protein
MILLIIIVALVVLAGGLLLWDAPWAAETEPLSDEEAYQHTLPLSNAERIER